MDLYQIFLNKLHLKRRSAPNSDNWPEYLIFCLFPFAYVAGHPLLAFLSIAFLIIGGTTAGIVLLIPMVFHSIYKANEEKYLLRTGNDAREIVYLIQVAHHQTMLEKLHRDPDLLRQTYKKKSLLYWCRYYKNEEAHRIIIGLLKKNTSRKAA